MRVIVEITMVDVRTYVYRLRSTPSLTVSARCQLTKQNITLSTLTTLRPVS